MEMDRAASARSCEARPTSEVFEAGDHQRDILSDSERVRVADAAERPAALADLLLLLCALAEGRSVGAHSRSAARKRAAQTRKKKAPTAAIIDAQSVKTANHPGMRGYDAGKKVVGRKRHLVVDTLGLILGVEITPANLSDSAGAQQVLPRVLRRFGWLRHFWADAAYAGPRLVEVMRQEAPRRGARLEIVKRLDGTGRGFVVQRKRWIVERTFAWLSTNRRLVKDYEARPDHSLAFIHVAASRLMLKRLKS